VHRLEEMLRLFQVLEAVCPEVPEAYPGGQVVDGEDLHSM
jgi:hypothetical protein